MGMIIQWFARHEYLMHIIATALLNTNIGAITILMTGLGYAGKRDAVKSLLNYVEINESHATKINEYLDKLHTHSGLRNGVAHSTWTEGSRPDAIKPLRIQVRGGKGKIIGTEESEQDYTSQELLDTANDIGALYNEFKDYIVGIGLMSIVEENITLKRVETS